MRGDAYCYPKIKQEEIVIEYGAKYNLPYVSVRSGVVYGLGNEGIHGRIGVKLPMKEGKIILSPSSEKRNWQ